MKKEKSFKVKKNIKAEDTEKLRYETRTMEKDIEELKKKSGIIDSKKLPEPPAPPLKTPKLPEAPKPPEALKPSKATKLPKVTKPSKKRKRKILVPLITIVIILLVVGGVIYWWNYLRVPKEEEPKIEKQELEIPVSLIEVDVSGTVEIKEGEDEALFGKLKERAAQEQEQGTFQRILIKNIGLEKDHFLSFQEIAEILYINIPLNILNSLTEEHTLFLYSQKEGNRSGVIIKVRDTQNLADYLKFWEETMETDLALFFLDKKINESIDEEFKDNIYKDIDIRYLNFPDPSLTIDYVVVENYLIITTSREGMYGVIDKNF